MIKREYVFFFIFFPKNTFGTPCNHVNGAMGRFKDTVKPVLSGHSKLEKTKILMTNGSLMKAESIQSLGAFCNIFDLH